MTTLFMTFLFASLVSFIGSLQLGPVNMFVMHTTLYNGKKTALWVALGGSIPEYLYCYLAVYIYSFFEGNKFLQTTLQISFVIALIAVSVVLWTRKSNQSAGKSRHAHYSPLSGFLKGFSLALLNPQLLPFWMFVQVYCISIKFPEIQSNGQKISFILGAGFGALLLLASLVLIVCKYELQMLKYINHRFYFKALALLLFGISIQQIVTLLSQHYTP